MAFWCSVQSIKAPQTLNPTIKKKHLQVVPSLHYMGQMVVMEICLCLKNINPI